MLVSVVYIVLQRVLQLFVLLFRSTESKDLEIVVLRHELGVLRRCAHRPRFRVGDRLFLAAASRLLPRVSWRCFLVTPATPCGGTGASWRSAGPMRDRRDDRRLTLRFER